MEFKQLTIFKTAAQELNFTRTATILGYAQSSITSHIQSLEDELGLKLFERIGKRLVLTNPGAKLIKYADQILGLQEEAKEAIGQSSEPSGTLTICVSETHCTYRLPSLLNEFQTKYPNVELIFRPGICEREFPILLSKGLVDVALLSMSPAEFENLIVDKLFQEPIVVICQPEHILTHKKKIKPEDLANQNLLLTEKCDYRNKFEDWLEEAKVYPHNRLELADVEAIKRCVMAGVGIAALPKIAVQKEVEEGKLAILPTNSLEFPIFAQLFWHKDKWISPALRAFLDVTRKVLLGNVK